MTDRTAAQPDRHVISAALVGIALLLGACADDAALVQQVRAPEAADLLDQSDADLVVIDVRTPEEFTQGHVEGARNLDLEGGDFTAAFDGLDRDARYLTPATCCTARPGIAAGRPPSSWPTPASPPSTTLAGTPT